MTTVAILTEVASNIGHCGGIFISLKDRIKYRRFVQETYERCGWESFLSLCSPTVPVHTYTYVCLWFQTRFQVPCHVVVSVVF
jgi:hypothetical protein